MQRIVVMSLGEIVQQNIADALNQFTDVIDLKLSESGATPPPKGEIYQRLGKLLGEHIKQIEAYKLGQLSDDEFDNLMLGAIGTEFSVVMNASELDYCWQAMNPKYAAFQQALQQIKFFKMHNENCDVVLISACNHKDLSNMISELESNRVDYQFTEDGAEPAMIDGNTLYASYIMQKSKLELLKMVSQMYHGDEYKVFYLHGIPTPKDAAVFKQYQKEMQEIRENALEYRVELIEWNKSQYTLTEILNAIVNPGKLATSQGLPTSDIPPDAKVYAP